MDCTAQNGDSSSEQHRKTDSSSTATPNYIYAIPYDRENHIEFIPLSNYSRVFTPQTPVLCVLVVLRIGMGSHIVVYFQSYVLCT